MIICIDQSADQTTKGSPYQAIDSEDKLVTWEEFQNAFIASGYPTPTINQYENFVKNARIAGGIENKRELAMFLAQIMWESGGLLYNQELACLSNGCPGHYETVNDYPGVRYFGRGKLIAKTI